MVGIIMITIATYTAWKVTMAIVNIVKAHKKKALLLITLRNIGCADAAMSVLTLEHSMIATFGSGESRLAATMDGAVGMGAFLIVLLLGISMIVPFGCDRMRKRQEANIDSPSQRKGPIT